ncbi:hypothetical protein EB001_24905, partial [bacterium]|nr:hypothetical protein [bacterium]
MPAIILLKRKAIRVYPDHQKVALYYSQALDKYITIPFGENVTGINEDNLEEISQALAQRAAVERAKQSVPTDDTPEEAARAAIAGEKSNQIIKHMGNKIKFGPVGPNGPQKPGSSRSWGGKNAQVGARAAANKAITDIKNNSKKSAFDNVPSGWEGVGHLGAHGAVGAMKLIGRVTGKFAQTIAPKTSDKVASGVSNAVKSAVTGARKFGTATGILSEVKESFYAKIRNKQQINELSLADVGDAADTAADWVVPYYSAGKKLYKGDYAGAATDAAIDTAAMAIAGPFGRVGAKLGTKLL